MWGVVAANRNHPQHPLEFEKLKEWVKDCESILEIGARYGANLVGMAHAMKGKRIVSVDWPDKEGWNDPNAGNVLEANVKMLQGEGYDATLIIGDSHSIDVVQRVRLLAPFDLVFIDGDHSYSGVKQDWENYGPMGKVVIFHDIMKPHKSTNPGLEVWKLWQEIKVSRETTEFVAPDSPMGLGRVGTAI